MAQDNRDAKPDAALVFYRRAILVIFLLLVLRLLWMQVLKYPVFLGRAVSNKLKTIPQVAPRGQIFDRAGKPLAANVPVFSLMYFPPSDPETDVVLVNAAAALRVPEEALFERIARDKKRNYTYQPVALWDSLTLEQVTYFEENADLFPGIFIEENNFKRNYPLGSATAHVIGYTGFISDSDPKSLINFGYERDEYVGKTGIEKSYESILHGRSGSLEIEVTKDRVFKRLVREIPAVGGEDIYLSIDSEIQATAFECLQGRRGCAIVSRPDTGEIIAIVSSPGFDANLFYEPDGAAYRMKIIGDTAGKPEFFRAIGGTYPPGSVFKLVTALAGLETGEASENTQWTCDGTFVLGNRTLKEEYAVGGHGPVVFKEAIAKSCDVAFWHLGVKIGSVGIGEYARRLGFGTPLGIDLPGEKGGLVPDRAFKLRRWHEEWWDGDTANMAIGQGFVLATPLQVLWSVNQIVTDGHAPKPHLLKAAFRDGKVTPVEGPETPDIGISPNSTRIIREGMRRGVLYGTSKQLRNIGVACAGKTGTADVPHGKEPHAWFAGFFPYDQPAYSIVVLIENGGRAADTAVPTAGEIIKRIALIDNL